MDEDRAVVRRLTVGSRVFWMWVGGLTLWGVVVVCHLLFGT